MMEPFRAFRIHRQDDAIQGKLESISLDDLSPGDLVLRGEWSSINYKDALAATGAGKILRRFPLVGGIDVAGTVLQSEDDHFVPGSKVLVAGAGLGETRDGGFAERVRVPANIAVPIPDGMSTRQAMALGTAGFTAALAILHMEHNGQSPEHGTIAVSGATGGVGSLSIDMLSSRGYEVVAFSRKANQTHYLRELGAAEVSSPEEIDFGSKPLETARFGGAVDNVGGELLNWFLKTTKYGGNVASIGLAGSPELHTTVFPFILRGVNLLGINSVDTPHDERLMVWQKLAGDLAPRHLDAIVTHEVALSELPSHFASHLGGSVVGRTLVRLCDDE